MANLTINIPSIKAINQTWELELMNGRETGSNLHVRIFISSIRFDRKTRSYLFDVFGLRYSNNTTNSSAKLFASYKKRSTASNQQHYMCTELKQTIMYIEVRLKRDDSNEVWIFEINLSILTQANVYIYEYLWMNNDS